MTLWTILSPKQLSLLQKQKNSQQPLLLHSTTTTLQDKSQIRPCMEYCWYIWGGSSNDALSLLDKVQKRIVNIVELALADNLQPLSHCCNFGSLSLFYKYYNGHCSKELVFLVPSTKIHSRVTRHSIESHPFSVTVPKCSKNAYSSSFFLQHQLFGIRFLHHVFLIHIICNPDSYNL
ncbi:uncharacterized protein LOC136081276 [Hydra vulgaris]|uniref:Uncharacterized protein LOC136081276 n=1 Tax=Hydra vulgaris TaxID=6087 RepID=A0ABM4BZH5_HYDVU